MILHGNPRGGAKNMALHLLKTENDHVELYELRGFVSNNLVSALNEIHAISKGTKARQFLFSLSLNPPSKEEVSTEAFKDAIERVEKKLNLTDQPRAIVFHEKKGRRHCHAVWSRIDAKAMKAIPLPFHKYKLRDISRELYRKHGWNMPRGLMNSAERDPNNYTLAQWQQAKRTGKKPRDIKTVFQDCWAVSDSQVAFQQALKDHGYILAKGDRRGFVALDHRCEVFAVPKWVGIKAKDVHVKLTDRNSLPSVTETKEKIALDMTHHLSKLQSQQNTAIKSRLSEIETLKPRLKKKHQSERKIFFEQQAQRQNEEIKFRQERYNRGFKGLLDRITGKHRRIKELNEWELAQSEKRDVAEKDSLIFKQLEQSRLLEERFNRLENFRQSSKDLLSQDISQYKEVSDRKRDAVQFDQHQSIHQLQQAPTRAR